MEHVTRPNLTEQLPVMEYFYTIQGEGYHCGKAAFFIRLGGCDLGCHWCDVKESWPTDTHQMINIQKLVDLIPDKVEIVVITGGEPLMYDLTLLTELIQKRNIKTHIETSGAYPVTGSWDWFCLSPKKVKLPTESSYTHANELKVIIYNKHDFLFAKEQAKKTAPDTQLFLQPEWSKSEQINQQIVDFVKANPKWRISIQTHKILDIP